MAKGARSNSFKKLGTWKRNRLVPGWQEKADEKRFAALAACAAAPGVAPNVVPQSDQDVQMERGRADIPRKEKKAKPVEEDESMDEDDVPQPKRKGKKAQNGLRAGRVQKKRRAGKLFMTGIKSQFHPRKKAGKGHN